MTPEEFRQAYFDQYADDGDVCNDAWFHQYFDNSTDWLEVIYRAPDEGLMVYIDPESDLGGYWASTSGGVIEGPFQTKAELAVSLGYAPGNFAPDGDADADDFDDLDEDLEDDEEEADPDFDEDEDFDEDFGDEDEDEDED